MKQIEFHRKKLDNGITVLFEKRKIPVVSSCTAVKFGAQHEKEKIKGISHFIEHLVFKGTKTRDVIQISEEVENKGGILNAFTGEELTGFWNKLPSKHFELGVDILRDLVLNPLFEKQALERERKVILEEIKMYHNNPAAHILDKIKEMLYEPPFSASITGTLKTVVGLSIEKVIKLFDSIYSSNNMIFCVVGNANWQDVLNEAKKFPKTNKVIRDILIIPKNNEFIEKRKGIDQAHEVLGFHMPKLNEKGQYASEVFDSILGGGLSSRLFQEIREKRGLCYAIKSHLEQSKDYSYEVIYVGTTKDKVKEIKLLILKEIKKLKDLSVRDLIEVKERLIGLRQISKEKSDAVMIGLLQEELGGNAENFYKYEAQINKVKLKDVQALSKLKGYSFVGLVPY